jgi:cobalt-precorrin 5A hydrolase
MDDHKIMTATLSIGIGCSSRATSDDVIQLIRSCVTELLPNSLLATLDRCASVAETVATSLGLQLMLFPASALAQVAGTTVHSELALARTGTPSVAEASALLSLGPQARLIVPRQTGHLCTCAVAVLP